MHATDHSVDPTAEVPVRGGAPRATSAPKVLCRRAAYASCVRDHPRHRGRTLPVIGRNMPWLCLPKPCGSVTASRPVGDRASHPSSDRDGGRSRRENKARRPAQPLEPAGYRWVQRTVPGCRHGTGLVSGQPVAHPADLHPPRAVGGGRARGCRYVDADSQVPLGEGADHAMRARVADRREVGRCGRLEAQAPTEGGRWGR